MLRRQLSAVSRVLADPEDFDRALEDPPYSSNIIKPFRCTLQCGQRVALDLESVMAPRSGKQRQIWNPAPTNL
jgi:hypothetical protein